MSAAPSNITEKSAGLFLILASLGAIFTMLHHPTIGSDGFSSALQEIRAEAPVNRLIHGVMITFALVFYIALTIHSRLLNRQHILTTAGDVFMAAATAAMCGAALISGYMTTDLAFRYDDALAADAEIFRAQLRLTGAGNQALATFGSVAYGAAVLSWSLRLATHRPRALIAGGLGVAIGGGVVVAILSGWVILDVAGMSAVIIALSAWFAAAGIRLLRASVSDNASVSAG